ncbi:hypothetical protein AGDE_14194 [Angomonas deanei]|nr:hypothetical protein AGDE_14194 [Angomonas deanei]|eukprot:EPY21256.1 hypothetical protein AGDE_14194 [Angomonas deanei]
MVCAGVGLPPRRPAVGAPPRFACALPMGPPSAPRASTDGWLVPIPEKREEGPAAGGGDGDGFGLPKIETPPLLRSGMVSAAAADGPRATGGRPSPCDTVELKLRRSLAKGSLKSI